MLAGVRKPDDGDALVAAGGERVVPILLDVTDAAQIARATERVGEIAPGGWTRLSTTPGLVTGARWS